MRVIWEKLVEKKELFLAGFIVLSLFFPAFYSTFEIDYKGIYYAEFCWPYLFAGLYLLLSIWKRPGKKFSLFLGFYFLLLAVYDLLSLYFNLKYLHWHWEAINNTLAFMLFGMLIWHEKEWMGKGNSILRWLIACIGGSTLLSILYHFTGYTGLYICNNRIYQYMEPLTYESRNYWLYSHKSDYALMLLLFMAVTLRWHKVFSRRWRWIPWGTIVLLLAAVWQTHSWTGIAGMLLVIAGFLLDKVNWKSWKWWYLAVPVVLAGAGWKVLGRILAERDLSSMGSRFSIWQGAIETIKKYPQGWGMRFGDSMFYAATGDMYNNAHNVFLNALLRFSIPVGICFALLFLCILIFSLVKSRSFLAVGMWVGMLMLMTMDYALLNFEIVMVLFLVYLVCIYKEKAELGSNMENQQTG